MLYKTIKDNDYELVFIVSFLESTIEMAATKVEIEKEIQEFGSEPCADCGYYHDDGIDHTDEDNLPILREDEEDGYYYGYHHDDDTEDSDSNADDAEGSGDDDADDDDHPRLKLTEGVTLSFVRRVKPDMANGYVSAKKLESRNRYRKEVENLLEALVNGYLLNNKQYLKTVYNTIRNCEDHDGVVCYNRVDGDIVEIPEEEEAKKYVRVVVPDNWLGEYNISHSGDDEGEQ